MSVRKMVLIPVDKYQNLRSGNCHARQEKEEGFQSSTIQATETQRTPNPILKDQVVETNNPKQATTTTSLKIKDQVPIPFPPPPSLSVITLPRSKKKRSKRLSWIKI